jgi:cysteinyl-tRNA synthetase
LKFPHHEAEIAQQEAASGKKPLVKFWMHTGFLLVNGQKMSKSLNNFITIEDFLKKYPPSALRYLVLLHHYRSPIDYSEALVEQSLSSLRTIQNFLYRLQFVSKKGKGNKDLSSAIKKSREAFHESMSEDFNTPKALASVFDLINITEKEIWQISSNGANEIATFISKNLGILGIKLETSHFVPLKVKYLVFRRLRARNNKQFIQSDTLRNRINELGYSVEDTPCGQFVHRND